nr:hypothetical protein [Mucilaginibacter sp. X4EP1]
MNYSFGNNFTPIKVTKKLNSKKIRISGIIKIETSIIQLIL